MSQKTHDALQREYDRSVGELEATVAERDAQLLELEEALASEEQRVATLESEVMDLGAKLDHLEGELSRTAAAKDEAEAELAAALASKRDLKASIEDMKRALHEASERRIAAERRISEYRDMLRKFKPLIDAGKLEVQVVEGRMVLVLPTDILFDSGSAKLSEAGGEAIGEVGRALATLGTKRFQVEGHTDTVPIRTAKYPSNWELASARALGVVRALLEAGVAPARVSAASFGEHRPAHSNEDDAGKAQNRRIEIVIVPDLSGLPGFEELNELAKPKQIAPRPSGS